MPNMGFAAALLACLVTTCLMNEAYGDQDGDRGYLCSTLADCNYKGCADIPCTSPSKSCKNGMWDYNCDDNYANGDAKGCAYELEGDDAACPYPTPCAAGSYSTNGLDYLVPHLGLGACKPCDAGKYSAAGASTCSDCQAGKSSAAGASTCSDCQAGKYAAAGASTCADCQAGKISAAGASRCADCPDGKTSNALSTDCEPKVSSSNNSNNTAAIVGGVVGGVAAILVFIAVFMYIQKMKPPAATPAPLHAMQPPVDGPAVVTVHQGLTQDTATSSMSMPSANVSQFCQGCGKPSNPGALFCTGCGRSTTAASLA